jgi:hypothetical protein
MGDWFRSVTVLVMAFVGAVVVTIGLATVIVPGGAAGPQAAGGGDDGAGGESAPPSLQPIEGVGGHLTVTGDLEGTLTLNRESNDARYSLVGDDARMVFEGDPPAVAQVSWEGLEFFPEPSDCVITPGELNDQLGVGYAEVECTGLVDIRDGGTIDASGTLGLPLTMVGEADLPEMGGSATVGDETWEFDEALLLAIPFSAVAGEEDYNMILARAGTTDGCPGQDCSRTSLRFSYDVETHRLTLVNVERDGEDADLAAGACALEMTELGRLTPGTAVVEMTIDCPAAEVPGLGTVPITGRVIVQQIDFVP